MSTEMLDLKELDIACCHGSHTVKVGDVFQCVMQPGGTWRVLGFTGGRIYSPSGFGGAPIVNCQCLETGEVIEFCGDSVAMMLHEQTSSNI